MRVWIWKIRNITFQNTHTFKKLLFNTKRVFYSYSRSTIIETHGYWDSTNIETYHFALTESLTDRLQYGSWWVIDDKIDHFREYTYKVNTIQCTFLYKALCSQVW